MQKSRLGVSVGLLGAGLYFACFFGGYVPALLVAGYILLMEENIWLRKTAVKGVALLISFSILSAIIYLLPNGVSLIHSIATLFKGHFYVTFISNLTDILNNGLSLLQKVLFILLGWKALTQGTIKIPVIDSLVNKYMG